MNQTPRQGLADLTDPDDAPARPRLLDALWVPGVVEIEGAWLVWRGIDKQGRPAPPRETRAPAGRALLEKFLQLDPDRPETIRAYAVEYGPLYLCQRHALPLGHAGPGPGSRPGVGPPLVTPPAASAGPDVDPALARAAAELEELALTARLEALRAEVCLGLRDLDPTPDGVRSYREPLGAWGWYVRHARAVVSLASALHRGEIGALDDWRVALHGIGREVPWSWTSSMEERQERRVARATGWVFQWEELQLVVDQWLRWGDVRLALGMARLRDDRGKSWTHPQPKVGSTWGLFGNLAMQLLFAVSRAAGWIICANAGTGARGCEEVYFPRRQPPSDGKHWCPACRRREHSRTWYARRGRTMRRARRRTKAAGRAPASKKRR